ncbi:NAD-dependent epimerase/dehydratase family protein [Georgenia yuyongxinii]|uniref:NAD-dependent epimerase/dehydratase family protein n=1 Tax=Georgenia yuyongxinii TaxID=2589797 RepID=A0A552WYR3_9MICO|nr:NAD-dependent epimerase/dehydratase family protein [Georgenia yuyongxinii]TRW47493.1 NAD-dependent epimerase/dehydratase family protein [Georgenia yuyongxinii]
MRVLVTGASGMLGREVATALVRRGDEVTTLQRRPSGVPGARDVRGTVEDPAVVATATAGQDAVVHLAAKVSFAGAVSEFERTNVGGTRIVLDASRAAGASRFVFVSSPSVAHTGASIVGVGAGPAEPERARGSYARTKAAAELYALAADAPGFAVVAVRPHIVWGPGDTQLVQRVVDRAAAGRLPRVDTGAALIDTTYIDNAVGAIVAALDRAERAHGEAFVVTNGEPRPVYEVIAAMCRAGGVPAPRWSVPGPLARAAGGLIERVWAVRPGKDEPPMTRFLAEQMSTAHWFDLRRTRQVLGWVPTVSLDEGFDRLAAYYATR